MPGLRRNCGSPFDVWGVALPEINWDSLYVVPDENMVNYAVKLPSVYRPYVAANGKVGAKSFPPRSSRAPDSDEPWSVALYPQRYFVAEAPTESLVQAARAIYLDGVQKWIVYNTTSSGDEEYEVGGIFNFINIADQSVEIATIGYTFDTGALPTRNISGVEFQALPGSWCIGREYFVASFYSPGATLWRVYRIKFASGAKVQTQNEEEVGFDGTRYNIVCPTRRAYLRSSVDHDEPWCLAWRASDQRYVTGRWQNINTVMGSPVCVLDESEIENVLSEGTLYEVVCYNRIRETDLAIFRTVTDPVYFYFDGEQMVAITNGDEPTYITLDHNDDIVYGSKEFVRHLGSPGWYHEAVWDDSFSEVNGALFEILCNTHQIQLRGWQANLSNSTVPFDEPVFQDKDGLTYEINELAPILSWSFSYDGQVRIPHQIVYSHGSSTHRHVFGRSFEDYTHSSQHDVPNPQYPDDSPEEFIEVLKWAFCITHATIYSGVGFPILSNQSFDIVDPCPPGPCCRLMGLAQNF